MVRETTAPLFALSIFPRPFSVKSRLLVNDWLVYRPHEQLVSQSLRMLHVLLANYSLDAGVSRKRVGEKLRIRL